MAKVSENGGPESLSAKGGRRAKKGRGLPNGAYGTRIEKEVEWYWSPRLLVWYEIPE
jgi:hypothetical protein